MKRNCSIDSELVQIDNAATPAKGNSEGKDNLNSTIFIL